MIIINLYNFNILINLHEFLNDLIHFLLYKTNCYKKTVAVFKFGVKFFFNQKRSNFGGGDNHMTSVYFVFIFNEYLVLSTMPIHNAAGKLELFTQKS